MRIDKKLWSALKKLLPFLFAALALLVVLNSERVNAKEVITIDDVNDIQVLDYKSQKSKESFDDGDFVTIVANYKGKIESGSHLKWQWTNKEDSSKAYFADFNSEKTVYFTDRKSNQKVKAGLLRQTTDGAEIVILDNIKGKFQVDGQFSFNLQVRNTSDHIQILNIKGAESTKSVKVNATNEKKDKLITVTAHIGYNNKSEKNLIYWQTVLVPSEDKKINFEAKLSDGQKLDTDSIEISLIAKDENKTYSLKQFKEKYSDIAIEVKDNIISIKSDKNILDVDGILLSYDSVIDDSEIDDFKNKVTFQDKEYLIAVPNSDLNLSVKKIEPLTETTIKKDKLDLKLITKEKDGTAKTVNTDKIKDTGENQWISEEPKVISNQFSDGKKVKSNNKKRYVTHKPKSDKLGDEDDLTASKGKGDSKKLPQTSEKLYSLLISILGFIIVGLSWIIYNKRKF